MYGNLDDLHFDSIGEGPFPFSFTIDAKGKTWYAENGTLEAWGSWIDLEEGDIEILYETDLPEGLTEEEIINKIPF